MTVRVCLADDHPIVRQGLRNLLNSEPCFEVVGEASNGYSALDLLEELNPDVLVVDLMMPSLNGLEVVRRAKQTNPRLHIIVFSMQNADFYVTDALKFGASGYVLKESGPTEMIEAVKAVLNGEIYLSPDISKRLENSYSTKPNDKAVDPYDMLTKREREILQLAAEGSTSLEIARLFTISVRTAEIHRSHVMAKLDLHNQNDILRYALKRGIISLDG